MTSEPTLAMPANQKSNHGNQARKVILAVFAHPDDETYLGPVLVKYARQGMRVILLVVTDGRLGATSFGGYPAGDELAAARREEMLRAAEILGVELIHWKYHDQLRSSDGFRGFIAQCRGILEDLDRVIDQVQPDVVITFGPDGGYPHIDHKVVGSSVTQVILSKQREPQPQLLYFGIPVSQAGGKRVYGAVDDAYLTVKISYTEEDLETAKEAALCHKTQLRPEHIESTFANYRKHGRVVHFRPFVPPSEPKTDLFA